MTEFTSKFFAFEPDISASAPEPNLRQLVYFYYRQHMEKEQATECTNKYIEAFETLEIPKEIDLP